MTSALSHAAIAESQLREAMRDMEDPETALEWVRTKALVSIAASLVVISNKRH